jgi:hypothetical protein
MTRKDYIRAANIFNKHFTENKDVEQVNKVMNDFIIWFKEDNPNFDQKKFIEAARK